MIRKYIIPVLAALGIGFAIVMVVRGNKAVPPAPPVIEPVAPPFASSVAGAGIVEANTENIAIGTQIAGIVTEIYVVNGSRVKVGTPFFKLDDRELTAQLAIRKTALRMARANVKVAMASLADLQNQLDRAEVLTEEKVISVDELDRNRYAVQIAEAKLAYAREEVNSARANIKETETNLDRIIVRAPFDGEVLQMKIHLGEFASAGVTETPLMLFGNSEPLYIRVDVDENDAWRVRSAAPAVAFLRGNRNITTPLKFVRFERYVVPKKSLTGDSTERVDTRVLQILYSIERSDLQVFIGQQMDVFIEANNLTLLSPMVPQVNVSVIKKNTEINRQ
ncbi:MAG: efflux RND transporter periplasmic adaptor subunit [Candidatus Scalindua sp.]|nr:efflux RND transporter periplasmic adaptor subunit [Candidatus Scalindua sp.]